MLHGIDVSKYQGIIDWSKVATSQTFAFIRSSDGLRFPDSRFAENWRGAKASGLLRGAYQFVRPSQDALAQVRLLEQQLQAAGGLEDVDLPPVIDIEEDDDCTASAVQQCIIDWIVAAESILGRRPIVYTGPAFATVHRLGDLKIASLPLWVAHYTSHPSPTVPPPWTAWTFWQYTASAVVPGIPGHVDANHFFGTAADLQALVSYSGKPVTTPSAKADGF